MKNIFKFLALGAVALIVSCIPQEDDKIDIGTAPQNVTFDIAAAATPNTWTFKNTTPDVFQYFWSFGSAGSASGATVQKTFAFKGNYTVTLTVFGKGGSATATKTLNVLNDAPLDCESNALFKFLTNCDKKVWKLNPAEGALWVGPDPGTTWWQNNTGDVTGRPCLFNDEWTFTNLSKMIYDTKGDVFGEPYMGGINNICVAENTLGDAHKAWGSGTHSFEIIPGTPQKLKVTGLGAFIGLPKAANGAEVSTPQTSVTYTVIKTETKAGVDLVQLEVNFGPGIWRFTISSK